MNSKSKLDYTLSFKRNRCLNSVSESKSPDIIKRIDLLHNQVNSLTENSKIDSISVKNSIKWFIESMVDFENANKYFREYIFMIENINRIDENYSNYITNEFVSRILPYIENVSMVSKSIERYNLTKNQKDKIVKAVNEYIIIDRICTNHEKISKRFNISLEMKKMKSRGLKSIVEACCSMIDTYTVNPYAKFNLCIEEMVYVLEKERIPYDKKELIRYTTEYFLLRTPTLSPRDLKGYRTVLAENCFIESDDLENVEFIISGRGDFDQYKPSIKNEVERFLMELDKSIKGLEEVVINCMNSSTLDIKTNIDKLLFLIWNCFKNELFDFDEMITSIYDWIKCICKRLEANDISKSDLISILKNIENVKKSIYIGSSDEYDYIMKSVKFKDALDSLIYYIEDLTFTSYSEYNIKAIEFVNRENVEEIPLNEFKIFKFHNLVRATINLDKFLKYKEKQIYEKGSKKVRKVVKKIKDVLFPESTNMGTLRNLYKTIGEDAKSDICIEQYEIIDKESMMEICDFLEETCREFNNKLICENMNSIRCYYLINPGCIELHLKESSAIKLEESDWMIIRKSNLAELETYIEKFAYGQSCLESMEDYLEINIEKVLEQFFHNPNLTMKHYEVAMEALSLLDISDDQVSMFTESYTRYCYDTIVLESNNSEQKYLKEVNQINKIADEWVREEFVPLDVQIEALDALFAIAEATPTMSKPKVGADSANNKSTTNDTKEDNPNTKVDESRKNPFAGIKLSSIQLYLQGLKAKMKDMSAKEKEISRNLDNNFRRLVKGMKDALISDRREAIIKGSVIPSFSKCIKIAIGLAGLGLITGNPTVPLLTAIGGFAVSKRLTHKERILLLDEIETELEVLEKEISMAESKNQIKKYRALLKYKKDLQRQYQRIRYNVRVGKDILPGSTVGVKDFGK